MRDAPVRRAAYEKAAYEMAPMRRTSMRDDYEMVYGRCTPIGDVRLRDTFNQSIQIAFAIGNPQMASLRVSIIYKDHDRLF